MSTFKSQQEIWKYLADGGAVKNIDTKGVRRFEDGKLADACFFVYPGVWEPYIEPPKPVKRTFYRRKWAADKNGTLLYREHGSHLSKDAFDKAHAVGSGHYTWSDEWEEIEIELPEG